MKNHERIFRRSKSKDVVFFIISLVFVAGGFSVLENNLLMGWLGGFFFGIFGVGFLFNIIVNVAYLKLYEEGFEERTLLTTKSFKWNDVSNFEVRSFRWNKSLHFDHKDKFGNYKCRSIVSCYTIKSQDLIILMKKYKKESRNIPITRV